MKLYIINLLITSSFKPTIKVNTISKIIQPKLICLNFSILHYHQVVQTQSNMTNITQNRAFCGNIIYSL